MRLRVLSSPPGRSEAEVLWREGRVGRNIGHCSNYACRPIIACWGTPQASSRAHTHELHRLMCMAGPGKRWIRGSGKRDCCPAVRCREFHSRELFHPCIMLPRFSLPLPIQSPTYTWNCTEGHRLMCTAEPISARIPGVCDYPWESHPQRERQYHIALCLYNIPHAIVLHRKCTGRNISDARKVSFVKRFHNYFRFFHLFESGTCLLDEQTNTLLNASVISAVYTMMWLIYHQAWRYVTKNFIT